METPIVIAGAGIAGLTAGIELAAAGLPVNICETASAPGGKMRQVSLGGSAVDAGPTVFTMRWVFEDLFAGAGLAFDDFVRTRTAEVLARHAWSEDERLDLFADPDRSADAIGVFAGPREAEAFRAFSADAARIYRTLKDTYIAAPRPSVFGLVRRSGLGGLGDLWNIKPFRTVWQVLSKRFEDPRLRQLFGRYTTYCGGSPFETPATLLLVAHVEAEGVWMVDGGMIALAEALCRCARQLGAEVTFGVRVEEIVTSRGRVSGVVTSDGTHLPAGAVIVNGDIGAIAQGAFGPQVTKAVAGVPANKRSLSAVTWAADVTTAGFPLCRHNVFFSDAYRDEFEDIFDRRQLPGAPTVYVCAQDRDDTGDPPERGQGRERLLCLVNAPPVGDRHTFGKAEIDKCEATMIDRLNRCGLRIARESGPVRVTTPNDFARMFPGSGGAIYGRAPHGWMASFQRPGARSRIPGLYLAGGTVHPGPGVPMAAISGRLAAQALLADRISG